MPIHFIPGIFIQGLGLTMMSGARPSWFLILASELSPNRLIDESALLFLKANNEQGKFRGIKRHGTASLL